MICLKDFIVVVLVCFVFFCGKIHVIISTILKCAARWCYIHSHCHTTITTVHPWNFSSLIKLKLYPLDNDSPSLGNDHFTFCLHDFDYQVPHVSRIIQYLFSCDWLVSLSIMPSNFIDVEYCRISFPVVVKFFCFCF